jgi:hypothetical protein
VSSNLTADREGEYEARINHMAELLNDNETIIKKLKEQEKV